MLSQKCHPFAAHFDQRRYLTLRKYFPESSTPREMEEKIIGLLEESKAEKIVFRSDALKKYFPSSYSSKQIEDSIIKLLDQRLKKRKHEAER